MRKVMLMLLCIAAGAINWAAGAEKGYKGTVEAGFVGADMNRGEISMVNGYLGFRQVSESEFNFGRLHRM